MSDDVASLIAFKRKQLASLAEIGTDAAAAAIKRLSAEIAALDASSPEGVAASAEKPADPAAVHPSVVDALNARLASAESAIAALGSRLAVVEVLTERPA